jgi:hypothetical protein
LRADLTRSIDTKKNTSLSIKDFKEFLGFLKTNTSNADQAKVQGYITPAEKAFLIEKA